MPLHDSYWDEDPREEDCAEMHEAFGDQVPPTPLPLFERCRGCYMRQWCDVGRKAYRQKVNEYWEWKADEWHFLNYIKEREDDLRAVAEGKAQLIEHGNGDWHVCFFHEVW